ncbi:MAG: aminomethyl-transferring glycine dehydrogenase subunit GcvPA [Anaerolineae bacterium]
MTVDQETRAHPYIPNSVPAIKEQMLRAVGAESVDEFYADVPEALRLREPLDLPEALSSEQALRRHVEGLLARNTAAGSGAPGEYLSFLGAGCYHHHVPAVCDEVNGRGEFLTAYAGEPYDDHGRFQALFEYASMMGELLNMDVVNVPTYDGFQASATALRMASRLTEPADPDQRHEALVHGAIDPAKLSKILDYVRPVMDVRLLAYDPSTGQLDLDALRATISERTAAVYFENPAYLGFLEAQGAEIAEIAHAHGAQCVVAANPISLGVLAPPADYGADIVCGDIQPLGIHMQYGGGHGGYIATRDEVEYVMEYPSRLFGIAPTRVPGEYGFGDVAYERTSFAVREEGKEWVGTAAALWGITAGVYLALMGPQGMAELGEGLMARARYAMERLDRIAGARAPAFQAPHFHEFVVDFSATGRTVAEINAALLERGILGGVNLSRDFAALGQSALYNVTEVHTQADIDRLAAALEEVLA